MRLDECRTQIRQMLAEAEKQAESLRREADRRGYEEGLRGPPLMRIRN